MNKYGRTDLAIEDIDSDQVSLNNNDVIVEKTIVDNETSLKYRKKSGTYYTITTDVFVNLEHDRIYDVRDKLTNVLNELLDKYNFKFRDSVLIMGLGNRNITPDNLGPSVCDNIFISKHLLDLGVADDNLGCVSSLVPGVMAQTGMESSEILTSLVNVFKPKLVLVVDALASRSLHRVNQTIQITDAGINPGSGIGNKRKEISSDTLGIPVLAIGVPTVVDVVSIVSDSLDYIYQNSERSVKTNVERFMNGKDRVIREIIGESNLNFMVTPKEIDEIIMMLSDCISNSLNECFHHLERIN